MQDFRFSHELWEHYTCILSYLHDCADQSRVIEISRGFLCTLEEKAFFRPFSARAPVLSRAHFFED